MSNFKNHHTDTVRAILKCDVVFKPNGQSGEISGHADDVVLCSLGAVENGGWLYVWPESEGDFVGHMAWIHSSNVVIED